MRRCVATAIAGVTLVACSADTTEGTPDVGVGPGDAGAHGGNAGGAQGSDAGAVSGGDTAPSDSATPEDSVTPDAAPPGLAWPNPASFRTSDPWIMQHHDEISEMHPRLLVINFANGVALADVMARYELQRRAMQDATRFHGYRDPGARPFLNYELAKLVDLTDHPIPPGWAAPNSTKMPRRNGGIDFGALFTQAYADYYAIPDPQNSAHMMTLCELLAQGTMQELYIAFNKKSSDANVPEILEYKQVYGDDDVAIPQVFEPCAGNGCVDAADVTAFAACGRSLRVGFLEMTGVIGNSLHVNGHNYEHIGKALPHFQKMYKPFGNFDLSDRFATPFDDWYGACAYEQPADCVTFASTDALTWACDPGTPCSGQRGTMSPYRQGCGNAHFPPNARHQYDYYNASPVLSTCEHYGLHDGPGGTDKQTVYDATQGAAYEQVYGRGHVGAGWHIYVFQNFPGYKNSSKMSDGTPMKNWWPYLYY
jgi:hypothetical protein